jgi:hypothetical protein
VSKIRVAKTQQIECSNPDREKASSIHSKLIQTEVARFGMAILKMIDPENERSNLGSRLQNHGSAASVEPWEQPTMFSGLFAESP